MSQDQRGLRKTQKKQPGVKGDGERSIWLQTARGYFSVSPESHVMLGDLGSPCGLLLLINKRTYLKVIPQSGSAVNLSGDLKKEDGEEERSHAFCVRYGGQPCGRQAAEDWERQALQKEG